MPFQTRFVLTQTAILFLAVAIIAVATLSSTTRQLRESARTEIERASLLAARLIDNDLAETLSAARLMAENQTLKDILDRSDWETADRFLEATLHSLDADILALADARGVTVSQAERWGDNQIRPLSPRELGGPLFLSPSFREISAKRETASAIETFPPNLLAAAATSPVTDDRGKIKGYVRLARRIDDRFAEGLKTLSDVDIEIVRRGEILASTLRAANGEGEQASGLQPGKYFTSSEPLGAGAESATLIVAKQTAPLQKAQRLNATLIFTVALCVFIPVTLLARTAARRMIRPINRLAEGVREIEEGRLAVRVAAPGSDEIAQLASGFNRMAETLQRREEELKEQQRQLLQSAKLAGIGELAAGVAHEVGNPLAAISGYVQLLSGRPGETEKAAHYLDEIAKEVGYIDATIRELLDLARPSKEANAEFLAEDVVGEALRIASFHPEMKRIDCSLDLRAEGSLLMGRRQEFMQAVMNLIVNAAQSMPDGGKIDIGSKAEAGRFFLTVADEGAGIPESEREKIFDPFYTTKADGAGLGLSITYRIIERHGGRITIDGRREKGTAITIEAPLYTEEDSECGAGAPENESAAPDPIG